MRKVPGMTRKDEAASNFDDYLEGTVGRAARTVS